MISSTEIAASEQSKLKHLTSVPLGQCIPLPSLDKVLLKKLVKE